MTITIIAYFIGAIIGWNLYRVGQKAYLQWKEKKHTKEAQDEHDLVEKTKASFKRDGVESLYVHKEFATYDDNVALAKMWAKTIHGDMTWQQFAKEAKNLKSMQIEVVFK